MGDFLANFSVDIELISPEDLEKQLKKLNEEWKNKFSFEELSVEMKSSISRRLLFYLASENCCRLSCLEFLRLLSRDKTNIDALINEELIICLIKYAKYDGVDLVSTDNVSLIVEAEKCLCNFVFQSEKARRLFCSNSTLECLCQRIRQHANESAFATISYDIKFYDLRLLFLVTALCGDIRPKCRDEPCLVHESLTLILERYVSKSPLDTRDVDLVVEVLKDMFNILLSYKMASLEEDELTWFSKLATILRNLLLQSCDINDKAEELRSNCVSLLTAVPSVCYHNLTVAVSDLGATHRSIPLFDGYDMSAINVLLDFLDGRLDKPYREQTESLSPILTLLVEMARVCKVVRKYMRTRVLPPLRDVMHRPEEGSSLRNKLVKLMTSVTDTKDLAAEFLFQLCKCNVDRFIKYTGFGNAAGLLASRGLMGGLQKHQASQSDDENSDTEEYLNAKSSINPILGCYSDSKPNPFAGMSDEQKEYEAMKLVDEINKLMDKGVFVPGRVGEDGKIHPLEHVMQLQENIKNKTEEKQNDDESD